MLTPTITKYYNAVKAAYHVPQSKIGFGNRGSIGNGEGENQDDMMNDNLNNNMNMILSHLNFRLLEFAGIQDTILGFKNLTKKDEVRQGELDTQALVMVVKHGMKYGLHVVMSLMILNLLIIHGHQCKLHHHIFLRTRHSQLHLLNSHLMML